MLRCACEQLQPTCPSVSALVQRVLVNCHEEAGGVVLLLQALVGILFRVPYEIHHAAFHCMREQSDGHHDQQAASCLYVNRIRNFDDVLQDMTDFDHGNANTVSSLQFTKQVFDGAPPLLKIACHLDAELTHGTRALLHCASAQESRSIAAPVPSWRIWGSNVQGWFGDW
jgi:hypothetical protein